MIVPTSSKPCYAVQGLHGLDIENGNGNAMADTPSSQDTARPSLYYAPRSPGWRIGDIDWKFVIASQHYGTIVW